MVAHYRQEPIRAQVTRGPPPPPPSALMTAAATEPSHWEWIRGYCMMLLICSLQGNKVTVLPPLEWQKHHPSVQ